MGRTTPNSSLGLSEEGLTRIRQAAVFLAKDLPEWDPKALIFTGARHGDGCTTTTVETARALRDAAGFRPLMVLLGEPTGKMARLFPLNAERGLDDLSDPATALNTCVQRGPYDLPMIARRAAADGVANLPRAMARVLSEARTGYDVVLVDAPPILDHPETVAACQTIPYVVVVVRAGWTRYEVLERIAAGLDELGATLVGTVLSRHRRIIPNWFYNAFLR